MKHLVLATTVIICLFADFAHSQTNAQIKTPQALYMANARNCMNDLAASGREAGLETEWNDSDLLIRDPEQDQKLGELLRSAFKCLEAVFKRNKLVIEHPSKLGDGRRSWIWFGAVDNLYVWCAADGDSIPDLVGRMGGQGAKKSWFAIAFHCDISERILNWYKPSSADMQCSSTMSVGWGYSQEQATRHAWEALLQELDWEKWATWMAEKQEPGQAPGHSVKGYEAGCGVIDGRHACTVRATLCNP